MLGPMDSRSALLVLKQGLLDLYPIPVLSPGASSALLCSRYNHRRFFRCRASDRQTLTELATWLSDEHRRDFILSLVEHSDDDVPCYGEQNYAVFSELPESRRLSLLPAFRFPRGTARSQFRDGSSIFASHDRRRS